MTGSAGLAARAPAALRAMSAVTIVRVRDQCWNQADRQIAIRLRRGVDVTAWATGDRSIEVSSAETDGMFSSPFTSWSWRIEAQSPSFSFAQCLRMVLR